MSPPQSSSTALSTVNVDNSVISNRIARVAIDVPLRQSFDYLLPAEAATAIEVGVRVRAPFGKREVIGVVLEYAQHSELKHAALRPLNAVLDRRPLFDAALLRLLRWTADYYHHPLGEVIAGALPRALRAGAPVLALTRHWRLGAARSESGRRSDPGPRAEAARAVAAAGWRPARSDGGGHRSAPPRVTRSPARPGAARLA